MKKTYYSFKNNIAFRLIYVDGELLKIIVLTTEKIDFDGLKHHIEFYESDLDKKLFNKIKR